MHLRCVSCGLRIPAVRFRPAWVACTCSGPESSVSLLRYVHSGVLGGGHLRRFSINWSPPAVRFIQTSFEQINQKQSGWRALAVCRCHWLTPAVRYIRSSWLACTCEGPVSTGASLRYVSCGSLAGVHLGFSSVSWGSPCGTFHAASFHIKLSAAAFITQRGRGVHFPSAKEAGRPVHGGVYSGD